jgi:hypothetical protein
MKYLTSLITYLFLANFLHAAEPVKKINIAFKSEIGNVNGIAVLAHNQKHYCLTENDLTILVKIGTESDDAAELELKIYKNPENTKDKAKLIAHPRLSAKFGQEATITICETNKHQNVFQLSLACTISKE